MTTNLRLCLAIGIPCTLYVLGMAVLTLHIKSGFDALNTQLDDLDEFFESELARERGMLDARRKHLEEKK